jgi:glyoxylase-like metal-dependent hydrolase (beta-lactamase superfamily II)
VVEGFDLATVEYGRFGLDGGAMFGVVPRPIWERTNPPDARNRIALAMRGLVIRGRGVVAIVDCGAGDKMAPKLADIYAIRGPEGGIDAALARHGLACEDVTHVLLTHLHFDHAGGSTRVRDGRVVPTFPRARYVVQRRQLAWARSPSSRDRASYVADDFEPVAAAGLFQEVDGTFDVAPGLAVFPCSGHTPGHQGVRVTDGRETVLHLGDLLPTSSHLPVPFVMGYDLEPLGTCADKEAILGAAADGGHVVVFEHDPEVVAARIRRGAKSFEVSERLDF